MVTIVRVKKDRVPSKSKALKYKAAKEDAYLKVRKQHVLAKIDSAEHE